MPCSNYKQKIPSLTLTSYAGAIAGAVTGVVTTPLDVIKTRLMTQGSAKTYSGVFDCAQKIWQLEGPSAFLKVYLEIKA